MRLNFSIDGVEKGYEFLRWPAKWDELRRTIRFCALGLPFLGVKSTLHASITVSMLNVYDLPETRAWLGEHFREVPDYSFVHEPAYYSIRNLPRDVKEAVAVKLRKSAFRKEFEFLVRAMLDHAGEESLWQAFVIWTRRKDLYRGQRFGEAFPEYYSILRPSFERVLAEVPLHRRCDSEYRFS